MKINKIIVDKVPDFCDDCRFQKKYWACKVIDKDAWDDSDCPLTTDDYEFVGILYGVMIYVKSKEDAKKLHDMSKAMKSSEMDFTPPFIVETKGGVNVTMPRDGNLVITVTHD